MHFLAKYEVGQNAFRMVEKYVEIKDESRYQSVQSIVNAWIDQVNDFNRSKIRSFEYIPKVLLNY